jgi:hypothetical protein
MRLQLDERTVRAIVVEVAALLDTRPVVPALVDAATIAEQLGVDRTYVYEHATELGAKRLGRGPKAPLRFDPADVMRRVEEWSASPAPDERRAASQSRRRSTTPARTRDRELLPIRGDRG